MAFHQVVVRTRAVNFSLSLALAAALLLFFTTLGASAERTVDHEPAAAEEDRIPGQYIVVFRNSVKHPGSLAQRQTGEANGDLGFVYRSALKGYSAELTPSAVKALRQDPRVKHVTPDREMSVDAQTIPPGVQRIFADENAVLDIDGVDDIRVDADVAIIDTGADDTHPDLNVVEHVNCVPSGESGSFQECVSGGPNLYGNHGTHVAGTVGAIDNDQGVVGVAPGARLWSVRVLGSNGTGATSWIIGGIDWVTARATSIEVANMSIGGSGTSIPQNEAITASVDAGVVYAVSAGNNGANAATQRPANHPDVITVSALADYNGLPGGGASPQCSTSAGPDDDVLAGFSNWGADVDIAAPGACVYSTLPNGGYGYMNGTSMASPHVAGAAAVLASESNPQNRSNVEAIRSALVEAGSLSWDDTGADGKFEPLLYLDDTPLTQTEVGTGGATSTDGETATLTGAVNPRGLATQYWFEWGASAEYGQSAPASPASLSGTGYSPVSLEIVGLKPGQTYHYRLVATNSGGTTYGQDRVVTTSRWTERTPQTSPSAQSERINDISCASAGSCMSIAWYYDGTNHMGSYSLSGGQWQFNTMPTPAGGSFPQTYGVSCTASTACTTVGKYQLEGGIVVPMAQRWNGSSWSLQFAPSPTLGSGYTRFKDVSCPSAGECIAVGYYEAAPEDWDAWTALWRNGSWSVLSTPMPVGASESDLWAVSCSSTTHCVAVGDYNNSKRLILFWDGTSWSVSSPASTSGHLYGVDCASINFCMAVGNGPVAEAWDGSKWSSSTPPRPTGSNWGVLWDVSCKSASYCVGAGGWEKGERVSALVDVWNGNSWALQAAPHEAETAYELRGVSCRALSACVSAGSGVGESERSLILARDDVITASATGVTPSTATLQGIVDPGGEATSYRFEYGPTSSYGLVVPIENESIGSGTEATDVSKQLPELQAEAIYHYRLVAYGPSGTVYGKDRTFRTGTTTPEYKSSFGTSGSGNGQFNRPRGIAVDQEGNVWVVDEMNHRVQKFNSKGEYVGKFGSFGTGNGQFNEPSDVAITAVGDLWVTDSGNDRVQKFNAQGQYLGQFGSSGTAVGKFAMPKGIAIGIDGTIWVTDHTYRRVQQFSAAGTFIRAVGETSYGGNGQTAFYYPDGIAVDGTGKVWVADRKNHKIQKLSSTGNYLGSFGSQGSADGQFEYPSVIDVKPSGDLLVADRSNGRIRQFTPSGEFVTKFGIQTGSEQEGLATAPGGTVYVSQGLKGKVEKWQQPLPGATTGSATSVGARQATLNGTVNPQGLSTTYRFDYGLTTAYGNSIPVPSQGIGGGTTPIAVDELVEGLEPWTTYHYRLVASSGSGTVYGADMTLKTLAATPEYKSSFGTSGSGNGQFNRPRGIAVDQEGNVWVVDEMNHRVQKFNSKGEYVGKFGSFGTGNGQFNEPSDVAITAVGDLWVTDSGNDRVQKFNAQGQYLGQFGSSGTAVGKFAMPKGIAIGIDGTIWVTDHTYRRVQQFSAAGTFIRAVGETSYGGNGQTAFYYPDGIAVDGTGKVWVADRKNHKIQKLSSTGNYLGSFGSQGSADGQFEYPSVIDVKPSGDLLVADRSNGRIRQFTPSGEFVTKFGIQTGSEQEGLATAPGGTVYVSQGLKGKVEKWVEP